MRKVTGIILILLSLPLLGLYILAISWPQGSSSFIEGFPILGNILILWITAFFNFRSSDGEKTRKRLKKPYLYSVTMVFVATLSATAYVSYPFRAGIMPEGAIFYSAISIVVFAFAFISAQDASNMPDLRDR